MVSKVTPHAYNLPVQYYDNISQDGSYGSPIADTVIVLNYDDTREDDGPVMGYRYKIKHKMDATTNMSGLTTKVNHRGGRVVTGIRDNYGDFNTHLVALIGAIDPLFGQQLGLPSTSDVDNQARMKYLNKVTEALHNFQSGTFLGELRETLHMIRNPGQGFRRGIDQYVSRAKKASRGTKRSVNRNLSDLWLEYSFGWKPLLSDIDSAAETLARLVVGVPQSIVVSASASGPSESVETIGENGIASVLWNYTNRQTSHVDVRYKGCIVMPIEGNLTLAKHLFGFNLGSFIPTVWELIPYSFLVDYFTNIGDILQSWSLIGTELRWQIRTVRQRVESSTFSSNPVFNYVDGIDQTWTAQEFVPSQTDITYKSVSRNREFGLPIPNFRFEIPGISSTKWLNIAALANGRRA